MNWHCSLNSTFAASFFFSNSPWSLGIYDSAVNSWLYCLSSGVPRALWIKPSSLEVCGSRARTGSTFEACCHQSGKGGLFVFPCYCLFLMWIIFPHQLWEQEDKCRLPDTLNVINNRLVINLINQSLSPRERKEKRLFLNLIPGHQVHAFGGLALSCSHCWACFCLVCMYKTPLNPKQPLVHSD